MGTRVRQAASLSKLQRVRLQILDKLAARRSSNGYAYRSSTSWQLVEAPTGTPTDPRQAASLSKLQRVRLQILDKLAACRTTSRRTPQSFSALAVKIGPFAHLNEARPVVWMSPLCVLEHLK